LKCLSACKLNLSYQPDGRIKPSIPGQEIDTFYRPHNFALWRCRHKNGYTGSVFKNQALPLTLGLFSMAYPATG
jgi:hypothetical protein